MPPGLLNYRSEGKITDHVEYYVVLPRKVGGSPPRIKHIHIIRELIAGFFLCFLQKDIGFTYIRRIYLRQHTFSSTKEKVCP